jgi:PAS domain S-box-containing protein
MTMPVPREAPSIRALTFPADDPVFAERVREILRDTPSGDTDRVLAALKQRLELVHRNVETRYREQLAGFGDSPVIYVFRDGSALPTVSQGDWIDDPAIARVVTDQQGNYLAANDEAATLFGVPQEGIVGSRAGTFTKPDARIDDADALWSALAARGRLHSVAVVRHPDGAEIPVEFVTIRDGDGPGRNVTLLRAIT